MSLVIRPVAMFKLLHYISALLSAFWLSCGLEYDIANGVRFHMVDHDSQRSTQNSGVMIVDENIGNGSNDNNFCFK